MGLPLTQLRAASTPAAAPTSPAHRRFSVRGLTFTGVLVAYVLLTIGVLIPSFVLSVDRYFLDLHLWGRHPAWYPWIHTYVMFGQRGPATLLFLPFFLWVAWRKRSTEPLVMLVTALILLNASVGVVKYAIGRIGPLHTDAVHLIFDGGNIYPSGHVSNTVVLYGLMAWIAPGFRRTAIALTVILSLTVGMGTIYLRTHWFSDVVGGWLAGALVLIALPTFLPIAQRWTDHAIAAVRARRLRRRARAGGQHSAGAGATPRTGAVRPVGAAHRSSPARAKPRPQRKATPVS